MSEPIDTTAVPGVLITNVVKVVKPSRLKKLIIPIGLASVAGISALVTKVITAKGEPEYVDTSDPDSLDSED